VEKRPDGALVVYTDIPGVVEERVVVPLEQLELVRIAKGTRVWLRGEPYGWHAAEISGAAGFDEYRVRIPGFSRDAKLSGGQFVVRWDRPLANPLEALASGMCDSPEYYEARRAFREQLLRQRSASRGFTAVLSAAVELYPHQLDTVARVLSDPVLRYLLADEVGLGKTIEAGLILRQLLLDDPQAMALVATPAPLVQQWQDELRGRLLLGNALSTGRIRLVSHDRLADRIGVREHVVVLVDEAHRLLPHLDRAPGLRADLLATKGLLLLSATPMRGDPSLFLELLHLIDPTAFPRDDVKAFTARVAAREAEATSVDALTSRYATASMRSSVLDELEATHGADPALGSLVNKCRAAVDIDAPEWASLVNYVRETYRISRRMIRHRRGTGSAESYPVAGRTAVFTKVDDPARIVVDDFLDQYQELLGGSVDVVTFGRMVVSGLGGPHALLRHLERRLAAPTEDELFVSERERALFENTTARLDLVGTRTRMEFVLDLVEARVDDGFKVVVVSTSVDVAQEFYEDSLARWPGRVSRHLCTMSREDQEKAIDRFLGARSGAVLVGDYTVEEGRNLQDAHVLVNMDLPLDVNRLEQRIGRLDRFAHRGEPAEVVVVTEPNSHWVAPHVRLLDEGVGIFEASVATLQRKLADLLNELTDEFPLKGSLAFDMDLATLRANLLEERTDVDLLEELESITVASDFDDAGVDELRDVEDDVEELRKAFVRLTSMKGGLDLRPFENEKTGVVRFENAAGRTIFGTPENISEQIVPLLSAPRTYAREAATGTTGVGPLRLGDPLVDWLEQYLRRDERGRARAVVRPYGGVNVPTLWLSCDFLVEFDSSQLLAENEAVRRRLSRRGDALLPPVIVRTWTDGAGPADPPITGVLEEAFDPRKDRLLKGLEWNKVQVELPDWRDLCLGASDAAWACLRTAPAVTTAPESAVVRAQAEIQRRLAVLEARSQRLPSAAERASARRDLAREQELGDSLLRGVEKPAVSIVACGAVVLWPT
jgi:ATP-dependent helicase HepA